MSAESAPVRVAFRTLGCKVNRVESDSIAADLLGRGAVLSDERDAGVIVINTCTVTGEADAKARKAVRQALKSTANAVVVVTGCLAAIDGDALRALDGRVVVEADKVDVAEKVAALLGIEAGVPDAAPAARVGEGFRTRALLKIEDGCDSGCSYCIVPSARGLPVSVGLERLAAEAAGLVAAGVHEIVLTGINIGRYRDGQAGLGEVVAAVADSGVERLRLSSIEPQDLTDDLLGVLASTRSICKHLHVPLQSGSDAVLARMNRRYSAEEYRGLLENARAALRDVTFTTDVIAGFPGETDADHAETLSTVEAVGFSKLHVFRYSRRPGTPAAAMAQVDAGVRSRRAAELRSVGDRLRSAHVESRVGHAVDVLVEDVEGAFVTGTTLDYLRVRTEAPGCAVGQSTRIVLERSMVVG